VHRISNIEIRLERNISLHSVINVLRVRIIPQFQKNCKLFLYLPLYCKLSRSKTHDIEFESRDWRQSQADWKAVFSVALRLSFPLRRTKLRNHSPQYFIQRLCTPSHKPLFCIGYFLGTQTDFMLHWLQITEYIFNYLYLNCDRGPPLWYSGQSPWLQIRRSGFDSRRYQIFWEVVGLERGPLSLVSTIEELLGRKK
jgi:hypothetical protein